MANPNLQPASNDDALQQLMQEALTVHDGRLGVLGQTPRGPYHELLRFSRLLGMWP